jgi:hypothetical protein
VAADKSFWRSIRRGQSVARQRFDSLQVFKYLLTSTIARRKTGKAADLYSAYIQLVYRCCCLTACFRIVFGLLVVGVHLSNARKRSPTEQPPAIEVTVGGLVGHSVHLPCGLPHSSPPNIQWFDEVYNDGEEPKRIYSSEAAGMRQ